MGWGGRTIRIAALAGRICAGISGTAAATLTGQEFAVIAGQIQGGMFHQKLAELLSGRQQSLAVHVHYIRRTFDGRADHVEDTDVAGLQFQRQGVHREQADSHAGHHGLLDRFVAAQADRARRLEEMILEHLLRHAA